MIIMFNNQVSVYYFSTEMFDARCRRIYQFNFIGSMVSLPRLSPSTELTVKVFVSNA